MSLVLLISGIFIIKGIFLWIFYSKEGWRPLLIGLITAIACYPLMVVLYHDTDIDFWLVLVLVMVFDIFMYNLLLKKNIVKSIIVSFFLNIFAIIYFLFGNG